LNLAQPAELLVIGYGNELRRDDGLGPKLAATIEQLALPVVRVLICHQLMPELAEPISQAHAVIFIDAALDNSQGVRVQRLTPAHPQQVVGHTAQPSGLLGLAVSLFGRHAEGWWITLPAFDLSYGEGLSERAQSFLSAGLDEFRKLWHVVCPSGARSK
jgi:hydrogenase maturation protease